MTYRLKRFPPARATENSVEAGIKHWLLRNDWYPVRLQSGLMRTMDERFLRIGTPGLPDYVVVHRSRPAFFLETKRPGGTLNPAQVRMRWELQSAYGLEVCVAESLDELMAWMRNHARETAG